MFRPNSASLPNLSRRLLLASAPLALAATVLPRSAWASVPMVAIENFAATGKDLGHTEVAKVVKS